MFKVLLAGICLLATCLSVSLPLHAQTAPLPDASFRITSVQEWDSIIAGLRNAAWTIRDQRDFFGTDARGRTPEDDWNDFVVAQEPLTQLDGLRKNAAVQTATGDEAGLQATFNEATPLLVTQIHAAALVMNYWTAELAVTFHQSTLEPWLNIAPIEDKKALENHFAATMQGLIKALGDGLTETSLEKKAAMAATLANTRRVSNDHYNQQRRTLLEKLAHSPGAPQLKSRKRESPCPPPVMPLAGKAIPSLAKDNASPSENYPPKARIGDIEASVVLQVAISETGCMEIAQVIETSGVDELDEAALLWAERANFVPAEKDQKPAAGTMPFKFTYKISD